MRALFISLALTAVTSEAWAQSCPAGAETSSTIAAGTLVKVVGLHQEDAYSSGGSGSIIGITGRPDSGLTNNGGCWFGGPFTDVNGNSYYFYKAAMDVVQAEAPLAAGCPAGAQRGNVRSGQRLTVLGVHPEDAYYGGTTINIGDSVTTTGDLTSDGCWLSGPAVHQNGTSLYFYKVALGTSGASRPTAPSGPVDEKSAALAAAGRGGASIAASIAALAIDDSLDTGVRTLLIGQYDLDRSGTVGTRRELDAIPCDALVAIDGRYRAKWGSSVRQILGFESSYIWVGYSIGMDEGLRSAADQRFASCGIR
jgi:hypothetical protein